MGFTSSVAHFLQQGHIYSNKATPPNSATLRAKNIQTTTASLDRYKKIEVIPLCLIRPPWIKAVLQQQQKQHKAYKLIETEHLFTE
jgi:hypothetical protein